MTYADVMATLEQRRTHVFANLHNEMRIDEEYITASDQWALDLMSPYMRAFPRDFKPKTIALGRLAMMSMAAGINNGTTPKVDVFVDSVRQNSKKAEQTASTMQAWARAFLSSIRPQLWSGAKHVGGLGACFPYFGIDKSRYPAMPDDPEKMAAYEAERRACRLVDFRMVHPRRVFWDRNHEEPQDCIIEEHISPAAAATAYPGHTWSEVAEGKNLKRIIYCSPTEYGVWVDGTSVVEGADADGTAENPYGQVWFSWAFSGIGFDGFDDDPVHDIQGNVRQGRGVIASALVAFNRAELLGASGAMPGRDIRGATQQERDRVASTYSTGPMSINDLGGDDTGMVHVEVQPVVDMPQFTRDQNVLIEQYMNLTYGQNFLRGLPTVDNATVNAQNLDLSERMYSAAKASYDHMCADILTKVFCMMRDSLESTQECFLQDDSADGGYVKLAPTDIPKDGWRIVVDMTPPTMTERQAAFANDKDLMMTMGYDASWLAKRQGIDNHDAERRKGDKRKLFEATADAAAQVSASKIQALIPQREEQMAVKNAERGVVVPTPVQQPPQQQARTPLPPGVGMVG